MINMVKVLYLLLITVLQSEAARILAVFPGPYLSHQMVFRPLTKELVRRGHELVVITPDPINEEIHNLTEINVHDVSYTFKNDFTMDYNGEDDTFEVVKNLFDFFHMVFEIQLNTRQVQNLINDENQFFDLIVVETVFQPALIFSHIFNAPAISISSLGSLDAFVKSIGVPTHPTIYPTIQRTKFLNLTLLEKIQEMITYYVVEGIIKDNEAKGDIMLKQQFGPNVPPLKDLTKNVSLYFFNVRHFWENNRPVPPNVVYLGGMHLDETTNIGLSQDIKEYLESSKNGVIYVNFGSHLKMSNLSMKKQELLLTSFSKLPYDIVLKWETEEELPVQSTNIRIFRWLPQAQLLKHPNIKLFITQAGLQSTDEAIAGGVPLLAIPLIGDQLYNAEQYVRFKIGMRLDLQTLTEETLLNAVETVIGDKSYRQNILKIRDIINDQPSSVERAVWWTEHILRHGGSHLLSSGANISWREYLELDLVMSVLFVVLLLLMTVSFAIVRFFRFVFMLVKSKIKRD